MDAGGGAKALPDPPPGRCATPSRRL